MAKRVGQVRWFSDEQVERNYPEDVTLASLQSGSIFSRKTQNIVQIGIQAPPGTKFYLNASPNPIMVGATGIYELNIDGLSSIDMISFERESLVNINNNAAAYLIVDYLYEE